jgi:hypothetical protein
MVHNLADDEVELGIRGLVWSVDGVNNDSIFVLQSEDFTKVGEVPRVRRGGKEFLSSGWGCGPVDEVLAARGDIKVSVSFDDGAGLEREPHSSFKSPVRDVDFGVLIILDSDEFFLLVSAGRIGFHFREGKAGAAGLAGGNERIVVIEKNISATAEIAVEGVYITAQRWRSGANDVLGELFKDAIVGRG